MPAPKPGTLPDWDTTLANLAVPPGGQIASGWTVNQIPPSNWMNWWMNLVGQWCEWLNDLQAENLTWIGNNSYSAQVALGNGLLGAQGDAVPLIQDITHPTATFRIEMDFGLVTDTSGKARLYRDQNGSIFWTQNAFWNQGAGLWQEDKAGAVHYRYYLANPTGLNLNSVPAGTVSWADAVWTTKRVVLDPNFPGGSFQGELFGLVAAGDAKFGTISPIPQFFALEATWGVSGAGQNPRFMLDGMGFVTCDGRCNSTNVAANLKISDSGAGNGLPVNCRPPHDRDFRGSAGDGNEYEILVGANGTLTVQNSLPNNTYIDLSMIHFATF